MLQLHLHCLSVRRLKCLLGCSNGDKERAKTTNCRSNHNFINDILLLITFGIVVLENDDDNDIHF